MRTSEASSTCEYCNGTGWEYDPETNTAKECRCGMIAKRIQENKLKFASIPETYRNINLKDIQTSYYTGENLNLMQGVARAIKFYLDNLDEMEEQGKGLYFWSSQKGSGKTMVATAMANELIDKHGKRVKFATSLDILDAIRSSYNKDSDETEDNLISDLTKAEILVIDDFGTERVSDWATERFYQIVNKRYINRMVTIYTSNYDIYELKYDDRITNRIIERSYVIHFPEESVREIKARMENKIG